MALAINAYYSATDSVTTEKSLVILRNLIKNGGYVDNVVSSSVASKCKRTVNALYYIFNRYDLLKTNNGIVKNIEPLIEILSAYAPFNNLKQGVSLISPQGDSTIIETSYAKCLHSLANDKDRFSATFFTIIMLDQQLIELDIVLEKEYGIKTDQDRKDFFRHAYLQEEEFKESFDACIRDHMDIQMVDPVWDKITMQNIRTVMPSVARYYLALKNDSKKLVKIVKKHRSLSDMLMYREMYGKY